jgi:hypothetical protein
MHNTLHDPRENEDQQQFRGIMQFEDSTGVGSFSNTLLAQAYSASEE